MDSFKILANYYEVSQPITVMFSFQLFAQLSVIIQELQIIHISFWLLNISFLFSCASHYVTFRPLIFVSHILYNHLLIDRIRFIIVRF